MLINTNSEELQNVFYLLRAIAYKLLTLGDITSYITQLVWSFNMSRYDIFF